MGEEKNKPEEPLGEDDNESLSTENEILKLKMQAQYGGVFGTMSDGLTPEMENEFLQNVMKFEEQWNNRKMISVYELTGRPSYQPLSELTEDEVKSEILRLVEQMKTHHVELDVRGKYKAEVIYQFITEELFLYETEDIRQTGMTTHFSYEDFHPNHQLDIQELTMEFLKNWFEQCFDEDTLLLNDQLFLLTDPTMPPVFITKEEVVRRIKKIFDSYQKFEDCKFALINFDVQWDEVNNRGMGFCEGGVKYNAILENGKTEPVEGPFKLYVSYEYGLWQVMHFVFPQFKWPNEE
jgi:hypothetical protein